MNLLITFVVGLFFIIGVYIIKLAKHRHVHTIENLSISMAFGAMIVLAVMDLIPEIMETFPKEKAYIPLIYIAVGVGLLKVLDVFIPDHNESDDSKEMIHIGLIASFAIILHNVIEGMAVYGLALQSSMQGCAFALGVGLHNIPMGMLIYSTLQGEERVKKYIVIGMAAVSTFLGGIFMALVQENMNAFMIGVLMCITLGMLVYIIVFELCPHIIRSRNKSISVSGILIGAVLVFLSMMFE